MAVHHADAVSLKDHLDRVKDHTSSPVATDYVTVAEYVTAEIEFARAWGLAVGLVEAGYIEMPFSYSVRQAIEAAIRMNDIYLARMPKEDGNGN